LLEFLSLEAIFEGGRYIDCIDIQFRKEATPLFFCERVNTSNFGQSTFESVARTNNSSSSKPPACETKYV
jgi:hypothetical protein